MLDLVTTSAGIVLPVKAHPKARKNAVTGVHDGRIKVSVTEAPEKGKANNAIVKLLAKSLGLSNAQIELHRGAVSPLKEFVVAGLTAEDLRQRIDALGIDS